ncbi:PID-CTERM protein-sorting domain-containing protein [Hymenobacter baengnokdamensis]|uniref:PID-CTERM protein-sorting domain-containing protein n=1 Tax=Hymenobacter baengnokdamensis TaxID=2615203 RepID=UPI00124670A2|nr:hypothetical protein [Hymenobacter baengnokdamensis]
MIKFFITAGVLLALAGGAQAQAPISTGPAPAAVTAVPLDGGASLLLLSGVAYGLRRLPKKRPVTA